jgi:hypothetical protein
LTVPVGFDCRELPIAMSLAAPPHQDAVTLRLGHAYQQRTDFHLRQPPVLAASGRGEPRDWPPVLEKPVRVETAGKLW